ncbi:hypothetical protein SDC9_137284 [bioreactor metagenome]|uniref:Uncharacterized protein n=1 Tax=bioreactor metagenome TaxID=1076179 RepID=A0A645DLK4_9ZZZZ
MNVHDGGAGVVAVVSGGDDLVGLLGQIGVGGLALECTGLSDGDDNFFLCHSRVPF